MNILSIFDGMSCGRLALQQAGIPVTNYFSAEIDPHAIQVANHNWPMDADKRLGDVTQINAANLPQIDILIGGSPCQGFSFAGKQLNFEDPRSKLFFEFVRLLKECKPKYFLLENVKMKKEYEDVITQYLGVKPLKINSKVLSKQNRDRLYWTNIPQTEIVPTNDQFNALLYRLGHGYLNDQLKIFNKYPGLAAQSPATKYRIVVDPSITPDTQLTPDLIQRLRHDNAASRSATPEECEEFQTLPIGYTACVKKSHRYKMIGNGWTVAIITHLLKLAK